MNWSSVVLKKYHFSVNPSNHLLVPSLETAEWPKTYEKSRPAEKQHPL